MADHSTFLNSNLHRWMTCPGTLSEIPPLRCEPGVEFWGSKLRACHCCGDVLPSTSIVSVGCSGIAHDLRVQIGDEVCLACFGG